VCYFVLFCAVYAEFYATLLVADSDICHVYTVSKSLIRSVAQNSAYSAQNSTKDTNVTDRQTDR